MSRLRINLLSRTHRAKRTYQRHLRNWQLICAAYGLVLLGVAVVFPMLDHFSTPSSAYGQAQSEMRIAQERAAIDSVRRELGDISRRQVLAQAVIDHPDWSILLRTLADCVSANVVLREVKVEPSTSTVQSTGQTKVTDVELLSSTSARVLVNAVARTQQDVSEFALKLERLGLFDNVQMVRSGRSGDGSGSGITFELECRIDASGETR